MNPYIDEMLAAFEGRCDRFGECDGCHYEKPLWEDPTPEGQECGWEYCERCWKTRYLSLLNLGSGSIDLGLERQDLPQGGAR